MERLHPAEHSGQRLNRDTDHVVHRLLRGQRNTGRLRVRAQHHRTRILRPEAFLHDARPHPPAGAQLGDLLEKVVMQIPEKRQMRGEVVDVHPARDRVLHVAEPIRDREREFLHRGRTGFADVVAGNRYRMEARRLLRTELDHIRDDPQRRLGRADPFLLRDELLEHVILDRAAHLAPRHPLALRVDQVHREQHRRRAVDRHRGRDLADRNPIEQPRHFLDRGD